MRRIENLCVVVYIYILQNKFNGRYIYNSVYRSNELIIIQMSKSILSLQIKVKS